MQSVAAERNDTDMFEPVSGWYFRACRRWNRGPGEIQSTSVETAHDLDGVGIRELALAADRRREVDAAERSVVDQRRNGGLDHRRLNHRLVTLNHHDDVGAIGFDGL